MISVEGWTTIRYLHAQGKSIRAISAELGVARNTVRAALRTDNVPHYARPARSNPQLAPFVEEITRMVRDQHLIGSRILRDLRPLGYTGGSTALYAYLRSLKAEGPDPRITARFETPPGQQGQFDWSEYTVTIGGAVLRVIVFCLTLAFSRRKFYWPSRDETQGSVFEALEAAFQFFGGIPKQLLVDNARALVTDARPEQFAWNQRFLELCGHYAVEPVACQPGRPQTKGKVERPFFYLQEHFIKGRTWASFDAFARDLAQFVTDDLDVQVHGTTRERPIDRFAREAPALTALPLVPFVGSHEQIRKVSWDCLLSFDGARYSVPWMYAGKQVWVRAVQGVQVIVRNLKGEEIARHARASVHGATTIVPAHYAGLRKDQPKTKAVVNDAFLRRFPDHAWFVEALRIQHPANGTDHLRSILSLADLYAAPALVGAFATARAYTTYSHRFVRGILEADGSSSPSIGTLLVFPPSQADGSAPLRVYQQLLELGQ